MRVRGHDSVCGGGAAAFTVFSFPEFDQYGKRMKCDAVQYSTIMSFFFILGVKKDKSTNAVPS